MFDRVLILAVNVVGGHLRAAQALQEAFRRIGAAREVRIADAMAYTSDLFRGRFMKAYVDVIQKVPDLYGWLYDHFDKPVECRTNRNLFEKLNTKPVLGLLDEYRPDLVISSHVLPAGIISWLRNEGRISTPHAVVVTDFDLHGMWLCDHYEQYFVALDETKLHLEALGVPAATVFATGIPIDPAFAQGQDRTEARRQLSLDPDLTTILVTSGSWGLGPVERIVQSLQGMQSPVQVVAVCAMNEQLKAGVDRIILACPPGGPVKTVCLGWTTQIHTYMSATGRKAPCRRPAFRR
jgi:processive 1,2-diacylglycerol beta-glucosyltransferase